MSGNPVQQFAVWILPILIAVTLHEAAHGYIALLLGDKTALRMGRISLNPLRHVDPFGTIIFPAAALLAGGPLFGWAKPVPVNFLALRHPRRDMVLVSLAGPGMNLLLAVLAAALIYIVPHLPDGAQDWTLQNLQNAIFLNILLAVFNMLPVPPLDGGRVVTGLLPRPLALPYARLERFGMLLVIGVFVLVPLVLGSTGRRYSPFVWLVAAPAIWLETQLYALFGFPT